MVGKKVDVAALVRQWRRWAFTSRTLANQAVQLGSRFDAELHSARAEVRLQAASLLEGAGDLDLVAREMHGAASHLAVRSPPLFDYDQAATRYTRARTWQACAWALDPSLPEVQPAWD